MTSRFKRAFLGLSALGMIAASAAITSPVQAAKCTSTTKLSWAGQSFAVGALPFNIAAEYDLDAKHCLDLSVVEVLSGSQTLANLVAGTAQFTVGTVDNFMGWHATAPMTVFREVQTAHLFDIVVGKDYFDSNLKGKTFKQMMSVLASGKLGITSAGGASEATWKQLASGAGATLSGAFIAGLTSAANIAPALSKKTVDAVVTWEPNTTLLTQGLTDSEAGVGVVAFSLKRPTKDMPAETNTPGLTLGATTAWFVEHKADAKNIDAMMDEAIAWARTPKNFAKVVAVIQKYSKVTNKVAISLAKEYVNYFSASGTINRTAWDITGPWYFNNLPAVVKNKSYTSNDFVYDLSVRDIKPLKLNKAYNAAYLAKTLGLATPKGSKISIVSNSTKVCTASSTGVTAKKAGTCDVIVTVTDKKAVGQKSKTRFARTFITVKK